MEHKTGLTKDAGWQFGIRRTVALPSNEIWDYLFSDKGMRLWAEGVDENFSTFKEYSHIRTKWKLKDWTNTSSLQIRVIASSKAGKTTIAVHADQLKDELQREQVKEYWTKIVMAITDEIVKGHT
jgi:activator of HSP90 ATPase